mmetsp:Transcript_30568/g.65882  ORF Transcript_30568/g.65882 Transcript_30568/m.65882 type:complete len:276 (-) Transcript_30568:125-952(-)
MKQRLHNQLAKILKNRIDATQIFKTLLRPLLAGEVGGALRVGRDAHLTTSRRPRGLLGRGDASYGLLGWGLCGCFRRWAVHFPKGVVQSSPISLHRGCSLCIIARRWQQGGSLEVLSWSCCRCWWRGEEVPSLGQDILCTWVLFPFLALVVFPTFRCRYRGRSCGCNHRSRCCCRSSRRGGCCCYTTELLGNDSLESLLLQSVVLREPLAELFPENVTAAKAARGLKLAFDSSDSMGQFLIHHCCGNHETHHNCLVGPLQLRVANFGHHCLPEEE